MIATYGYSIASKGGTHFDFFSSVRPSQGAPGLQNGLPLEATFQA